MRHPAARRLLDQVVQQGRLANASLPAHHQGPALAGASSIQELVEHAAFAVSTPATARRAPTYGRVGVGPAPTLGRLHRHLDGPGSMQEEPAVRHADLQPTQPQLL